MSQPRPDLKTIFLEALDRPDGPDRAAYLDGVCGSGSAIRSRIDALMLAHEAVGGFNESTNDPGVTQPGISA